MDSALIHAYIHEGLTWIGFGIVSGFLARILLPGRDPGGAVVTLILGLGGSIIGTSIYAWAGGEQIRDLISPLGFAIAIGGAMALLLVHRLCSGRIIDEDSDVGRRRGPHYAKRRSRVIYD